MSRRSLLLAAGILVLLTGGVSTVLCLLVRYEPKPCLNAKSDPDWAVHFEEKEINSYFAESFITSRFDQPLENEGISQPRVVIEPDMIRVAFRYGTGFWSTIISIDLQIWLPENAGTVVAMKLLGFHAGALPISAQSFFERVSDFGRQHSIEVNWYRDEGKPVALLKFDADNPHSTLELQNIHLEKGLIRIQGRCNDGSPLRAFLQLPAHADALKPQAD
jgi:hypothetical protein